jgi:multidrug resistance protein
VILEMDLRKRNIITALMVAMFIGAIEGTVVTTAIPTIVKDLSGFGLISWVFSTYFLTSAISTPVYGKLADLYGRKNILCIGITIFLVGSCLCGLSQSMYQLIVFRALQGLGAGSIFTVTYTIVGDIFSLAERTKVQGWLNAVWGIASIIGPFVGGFFIDYLSWHWIFFINVPFGIICIVLLQKYFKESLKRRKPRIDYAGILVLSAAIITLLLGVDIKIL